VSYSSELELVAVQS